MMVNYGRSYHVADGTAKNRMLGTGERRVAERALEIDDVSTFVHLSDPAASIRIHTRSIRNHLSYAAPSFFDGTLFRCIETFPLPCPARGRVGQFGKIYGSYTEGPPQITKIHEAAV